MMKNKNKKAESYRSPILDELENEISPKEFKRTEQRMLLAVKIKEGMDKKGMKPSALAKALDKNASEITKWLSGTHNFTTDTLFDIQDVLGIELISLNVVSKVQTVYRNQFVLVSEQTYSRDEFTQLIKSASVSGSAKAILNSHLEEVN